MRQQVVTLAVDHGAGVRLVNRCPLIPGLGVPFKARRGRRPAVAAGGENRVARVSRECPVGLERNTRPPHGGQCISGSPGSPDTRSPPDGVRVRGNPVQREWHMCSPGSSPVTTVTGRNGNARNTWKTTVCPVASCAPAGRLDPGGRLFSLSPCAERISNGGPARRARLKESRQSLATSGDPLPSA